jgi:DNA processing protein
MKPPTDDGDRLARLRLIRSQNVGPITFRDLMKYFPSAAEALEGLPALAARGGRKIKIYPKSQAEAEIAQAQALGARHLHMGEPGYPASLASTEDAPPVLLLIGNAQLLDKPMVGIVGARNASTNGRRLAREIAAGIAEGGFRISSIRRKIRRFTKNWSNVAPSSPRRHPA